MVPIIVPAMLLLAAAVAVAPLDHANPPEVRYGLDPFYVEVVTDDYCVTLHDEPPYVSVMPC